MMHYVYTHTTTEATTGYFSCEPSPPLPLEAALRFLAEHPFDDFMRRHVLSRLAALTAGQALDALRLAFPGGSFPPGIAALFDELALLDPAKQDALPPCAAATTNDSPASSLIFLRWKALPDRELHRQWNDLFTANMLQHRAMKGPEASGLPPLYPATDPAMDQERLRALPGLSPRFTAPFVAHIAGLHTLASAASVPGLPPHERPPAEETAALAEERLTALGIIAGREMRHTASLSPVALLRPWHVRLRVRHGRHDFALQGQATTYGRGLSVPAARASCLMEMAERASAYLSVAKDRVEGLAGPDAILCGRRSAVMDRHGAALDPNDYPLEAPYADSPLVWMQGQQAAGPDRREPVHVPVQLAGLFCNLDEIALFDAPGSTGLATGYTMPEAERAALLEIFERDAEATTPFVKSACFTLEADSAYDPVIHGLLADYKARGINVQFQDLTGPMGVPVYKCFVMSPKGVIAAGHGAGLSAKRAVISALTETPFPYPDGGPSGPLLRKLPVRKLHALPDYSLHSPAAELALLEDLLIRNGRPPAYVHLTRTDLGFPVVRAFIPGMELTADRDAFSRVPFRLWTNYAALFDRQGR